MGVFQLMDHCELCGKFLNPTAPGVSWSQSWGYCMDGSPDLYDPTYRCSPCTDKAGVRPTNCAAGYPGNGRNLISALPVVREGYRTERPVIDGEGSRDEPSSSNHNEKGQTNGS